MLHPGLVFRWETCLAKRIVESSSIWLVKESKRNQTIAHSAQALYRQFRKALAFCLRGFQIEILASAELQ